jgi:Ni/Co efflux regulator RcnB
MPFTYNAITFLHAQNASRKYTRYYTRDYSRYNYKKPQSGRSSIVTTYFLLLSFTSLLNMKNCA